MNKKGQALIEFVIILPIFLILIFGVIDAGRIFSSKIKLESEFNNVISLYKKGVDINNIKKEMDYNSKYKIVYKDEVLEINREIDLITPGLQLILDNPYIIKVSRNISHE